jgi:hypothetical protein
MSSRGNLRARAARLIASKDHTGDHRFRGKALAAWRAKRRAILRMLRRINRDQPVSWDAAYETSAMDCPTLVGEGGTKAGEKWVMKGMSLGFDWSNLG